jgi:hypothetical protein
MLSLGLLVRRSAPLASSALALAVALAACSDSASRAGRAPVAATTESLAATNAPPTDGNPAPCVCGTEPGCPPCPAPTAPVDAADARSERPPSGSTLAFPPAPVVAPQPRTAKPGDGVFVGLDVHRATAATSPIASTTIHPHRTRPDVSVLVVAIDTTRLAMELVAGTDEPEGTKVPRERRTGLVPRDRLPDLVAVTNGAFKRRHGQHGVGIAGEVLWPAIPDGCVFAKSTAGEHLVAPWTHLSARSSELAWWRQSPPCLVENGQKHGDLSNEYRAKRWGGAEDGKKDIRRSAIGVGADPRILYFAIGEWTTAEWLADALVAVGVTAAAELDINYSYTRLALYDHRPDGQLALRPPLLRDLKVPKRDYWSEPADRDFFYLAWR